MVRHLEPAVLEQCRHLTVDETFELTAGIEVGDDAAFGAHQMVVMVLRFLCPRMTITRLTPAEMVRICQWSHMLETLTWTLTNSCDRAQR